MFAPRVAYKSLDGILRRKIVKGGKSMFTPIRVPKFNVQAMYSSKIEGAKQFAGIQVKYLEGAFFTEGIGHYSA